VSTSFPFKFVDLGEPVPFKIEPNPNFPTEMEPVCILNNLGVPPGRDTFHHDRRRAASKRSRPLGTDIPLGNDGGARCWIVAAGRVS
jgi:hypothetical protein